MKLQEIFRFAFSKWNVPSTIAALVAKNDNTDEIPGNFQICFFKVKCTFNNKSSHPEVFLVKIVLKHKHKNYRTKTATPAPFILIRL